MQTSAQVHGFGSFSSEKSFLCSIIATLHQLVHKKRLPCLVVFPYHLNQNPYNQKHLQTMGCKSSKLAYTDDSIHVMLSHECKVAAMHGRAPPLCYKPRQPHPLLDGMDSTRTTDVTVDEMENADAINAKKEADRLLRCSSQHNDVVDARDLRYSKHFSHGRQ
jgi:hypothetical protein